MQAFPLFYKIDGRRALLVGGGDAAVAKARLLLAAGAVLTIVTDAPCAQIVAWSNSGRVVLRRRHFHINDVYDNTLIISASDDLESDRLVARAARSAGIAVNVVDRPALSDFTMPAIVERGPVTVAISTGGSAPVLARHIRGLIETALPRNLGDLAIFVDQFRDAVKSVLQTAAGRRKFWDRFLVSPVARQVLAGVDATARQDMLALLNRSAAGEVQGRVAIVGAGPGDPELLTRKAHRLLQEADVIVHDRLVGEDILNLSRRDARRIYVGKARSDHFRTQDQINAILVEEASAGHLVVRLKGGDPFVFGRGGEEADHLKAHDIEVEVVPGITAAAGCAASAGIPLTHRDHASAVTFLSGQGRDGGDTNIDWALLANSRHTLVVYMGIDTARRSRDELIAHGRNPDTPIAIVENGTLADQRVIRGQLSDLPDLLQAQTVASPALIFIGEVAGTSAAGLTQYAAEPLALAL